MYKINILELITIYSVTTYLKSLMNKQNIFEGHGKRGYSGVFLNYSNPTAVQAYKTFTRTEDTYSYVQGKLKRAHPPSILSYTR